MQVRVNLPKTQKVAISPKAEAADLLDIAFVSPAAIVGSIRLDGLADVNVVDETAGASLIYNSTTGNFDVKRIDYSIIDGNEANVDGGTF